MSRTAYNIAYTTDYRGDTSPHPCFLFRGAPIATIEEVFVWLGGNGHAFDDFSITRESDIITHNGKSSSYLAVHINGFHDTFCSISDLPLLIEARFHAVLKCSLTKLTLSKFLNV